MHVPGGLPGTDAACAFRTCTAGACGTGYAPAHAPCAENGGAVCDGAGTCVVCVSDEDCAGEHARCTEARCESCDDGVQNGDETAVDCGGRCGKCSAGEPCRDKRDCASHLDCEKTALARRIELRDRHRGGRIRRAGEAPPTMNPSAPAPGTTLLGKYRIDGMMGTGGMGVVVAATHLDSTFQRVAIKFLRDVSPEAIARFQREVASS